MRIRFCAMHLAGQGGQEGFLRGLGNFLLERGHEVDVVATRADPLDGADCTLADLPAWARAFRAGRDWAAARAVAAASGRQECDVSFGGQKSWGCHVLRPGGGVEAEYWRARFESRHAWRFSRALARRLSWKRCFDLAAERRGYHDPVLRTIVANSDMVRGHVLRHYPGLKGKVRVVYNGADLERFQPQADEGMRARLLSELDLDPARFTAIFVAQDFLRKGLPQALAAVALAGRVQLLVLGGERPAAMQRLARKLGVADRVRFVGAAERPEDYYGAADVLLLPTFYDPCANVTFEALASGIPVITTRTNGAAGVIQEGREGWVTAAPGCVEPMADCLRALQDPARLADMKAAARALAESRPLQRTFAEIESILVEAGE